MNAVETDVSARAEKGSGHRFPQAESPFQNFSVSAFQIYPDSLLNPANDSVTRLYSLFHNRSKSYPNKFDAWK